MDINPEDAKEALRRGVRCSFVPHRLEIEGRPELNNFSLNVLFASFGMRNGERVMGDALYEPDLETYKEDGDEQSMRYNNAYSGSSYLLIIYNKETKRWRGDKFVNGEWAGSGYGNEWKNFFVHFTMLGLKNGERCRFDSVP